MSGKWRKTIFLCLFLFPVRGQSVRFDIDYARFRTSSDFLYLEIYTAIVRSDLKFVAVERRFRADYQTTVKIFAGDSLLVSDVQKNISYAASLAGITNSQKLTNLSRFAIREGDYKLSVAVTDLHANQTVTRQMDLQISNFPANELAISDIQLSSRIQPQKTEDKFCKNNYLVIPNPGGIFGSGLPLLYFYAEIYNLSEVGPAGQYRSKISVINDEGGEVRIFQDKLKKKPGESSVEIAGFNIISLHSGAYFLRLEIEDLDSKSLASASKKFFIYRPADYVRTVPENRKTIEKSGYLNTPQYQVYDTCAERKIDDEFAGAVYIASENDKKLFGSLDVAGKRQFMKQFWLNRDRDLSTSQNEFRDEYLKRLRFVNEKFGSGKPGWKADRGRVMLLYGEPDEIERFPSSSDNRAYEIWHFYNIQGGVIFIFVDIRGFGDYSLVHSTARNELQDFDWERWLPPR